MATPVKCSSRKTPTSAQRTPKSFFDEKFENFDAPMFRDFTQLTPTGQPVDSWFDIRCESPAKFDLEINSGDVNNVVTIKLNLEDPVPSFEPGTFSELKIASPLLFPEIQKLEPALEEDGIPAFQSLQHPGKPVVLPQRKRKLWEKPEVPKSQLPVGAVDDVKNEDEIAIESVAVSQAKPQKTPAPVKPSAKTPAIQQPQLPKATVIKPPTLRKSLIVTAPPASKPVPPPTSRQMWANTLTTPQEFTFMSRDKKSKETKQEPFVSARTKLNGFPTQLRAETEVVSSRPLTATRPVEFKFATRGRARHEAEAQVPEPPKPVVPFLSSIRTRLTHPQTFNFATAARKRATQSVPVEPPRQVRAVVAPKSKPVERAKVAPKAVTVPRVFNLSRPTRSAKPEEQQPAPPKFKAKPFNKAMFQAQPVVRPSRKRLTVPIPSMLTRKRKAEQSAQPPAEEKVVFKAQPAPDPTKAFVPEPSGKTLTIPEPFDLLTEVRGAEKTERLKSQLEEEFEREAEDRVFVARPAPDGEPELPVVDPAPLTVFEPFNLRSETLSLVAKQKQQERIEYEQALDEEMRRFKANVPVALNRRPFQPLPSNRTLTLPETPNLKSTVRAVDRADFSLEKNQRISEKEQREAREKALNEALEKQEIKNLRKSLVIKATPMPNPMPMRVGPSTRRSTIAFSPKLGTLRNMR